MEENGLTRLSRGAKIESGEQCLYYEIFYLRKKTVTAFIISRIPYRLVYYDVYTAVAVSLGVTTWTARRTSSLYVDHAVCGVYATR